jgi:small subunit ribosomal protein S17
VAEEEKDNVEETPEAEAPEEAPAAEEAPAEETPPSEEAPAEAEEPATNVEEPATDVEEPAAEPEEPAAEAQPEAPAEEEAEAISPRERRKLERSRHTGEAKPPRTPEERAQERAAERRRKAEQRRAYRKRQRERRSAEPAPEPTPPAERPAGKLKVRQGVVVSDKADKTITVRIDVARPHRMYGKIVRTSSMLHAHDERNEAHTGDTVRLVESRPLSRTKRWRLVEILERAR